MKRVWRSALALLALSTLPAMVIGCHQDSGLTSAQQQAADRYDQIAQQSGGDWNKVSQTDRDYMIKQFGSEQTARLMLAAKGGKMRGQAHPGGAPGH